MSKVDLEKSPEYAVHFNKYQGEAKRLGITPEMEVALLSFLKGVGVLVDCMSGDGSCSGDCPDGSSCISLNTMNCACSNIFQMQGNVATPR